MRKTHFSKPGSAARSRSLILASCRPFPITSHLSSEKLRNLPPPNAPVAVAVYGYGDQTGQMKPIAQGPNVQTLSRAVTQGATSILMKALQDAGNGRWFTVVERERLDNLLKERRIIADMRTALSRRADRQSPGAAAAAVRRRSP